MIGALVAGWPREALIAVRRAAGCPARVGAWRSEASRTSRRSGDLFMWSDFVYCIIV